ncbi:MAG TPA: alpha-amylase family protein [Kofleriaceae bacterium]
MVAAAANDGGERRVPWIAGGMHYWRVAKADWAGALKGLHAQGFMIVETPVPWRLHASSGSSSSGSSSSGSSSSGSSPGASASSLDFRGDLDLPAFIAAARAAGLLVSLRVGPTVNAELTSFGLPDHVLADPAVPAITSRNTHAWLPSPPRAFEIPSYASSAFHQHVKQWFAQLGRALSSHLDGVVALGVDHHAQVFYRSGAFDLDYHPDALAWWRDSTGLGDPPRAWDTADRGRCAAWVRFKEHYLARALSTFAQSLEATPLAGIAHTHALAPGHFALNASRELAHAIGGPVGISAYASRKQLRALRRNALAIAGTANTRACPVPLALEVSAGFPAWFPPPDLVESEEKSRSGFPAVNRGTSDTTRDRDQLLTVLAAGVRGFTLQPVVERDRHYGAPLRSDGTVEPHAAWLAPLISALNEVDWPTLRRAAPVALVDTRADLRFGIATSLAEPFTPALAEILNLGPGGIAELGSDEDAPLARRWQDAVCSALEIAQVPYVIVDEATPEDELAGYRAVIAPTLQRIDRGLWQRLRALAEHKRAIVVIGPTTPTHDELGQPLPHDSPPKRIGKIREGSLDDLPGLAGDLAGLVEQSDTWQIERPDDVRCFAYADAASVRAVIVVNDSAKAVSAALLAEGRALRDPLSKETVAIADGRAILSVAPYGVRFLIVER